MVQKPILLVLLIFIVYFTTLFIVKNYPESFSNFAPTTGGIFEGYQESATTTVTTTTTPTPIPYLIYSDEERGLRSYRAKNLKTEQVEFSSSDADVLLKKVLNASNGGKIMMKAGEYPMCCQITLPPNTYLVGEGMDNTILKRSGGMSIMIVAAGYNGKVILEGLTFDIDGGTIFNSNVLAPRGDVELRFSRFKRGGFGNVYIGSATTVLAIESEASDLLCTGGPGCAGWVVESEDPKNPALGIFLRSSAINNRGSGWHTENAGGDATAILYGYVARGNSQDFEITGASAIIREAPRYAVFGDVMDPQTLDPIQNVSIETTGVSIQTDRFGRYTMILPQTGTYRFTASKEGYENGTTEIQLDKSKHLDFNLTKQPIQITDVSANPNVANIGQNIIFSANVKTPTRDIYSFSVVDFLNSKHYCDIAFNPLDSSNIQCPPYIAAQSDIGDHKYYVTVSSKTHSATVGMYNFSVNGSTNLNIECSGCNVNSACNCSLQTDCNDGRWWISNSEGSPLSFTIYSLIPPTSISYIPISEGKLNATAICYSPIQAENSILVSVMGKFLDCPDKCQKDKMCTCTVRGCNSGLFTASQDKIPLASTLISGSSTSYKLVSTSIGLVNVSAICTDPIRPLTNSVIVIYSNVTTTTTTTTTTEPTETKTATEKGEAKETTAQAQPQEKQPLITYKGIMILFAIIGVSSFLGFYLYHKMKPTEYELLKKKWQRS